MGETPKGIVCLVIAPEGRVVAYTADFHPDKPGGYTLEDAQETRAKRVLARAFLRECAAPYVADSVDSYTAERVLTDVCAKAKFRIQTVYIGYDEDDT